MHCIYCNAPVDSDGAPPALDDDAVWAALAEEHHAGCEWVRTRAHRRSVQGGRRHALQPRPGKSRTVEIVVSDDDATLLDERKATGTPYSVTVREALAMLRAVPTKDTP